MFLRNSLLLIFFLVIGIYSATAQVGGSNYDVNSPYSRIGIGDIAPYGTIRNFGMGGIGVSFNNPEFLNNINPALLINHRSRGIDSMFSILDASILGQLRRISDGNASQTNGSLNFNSFAYALPINRKWTASLGLRPYSDVSYSIFTRSEIAGSPGDTAILNYTGTGGLYHADFSNGFRIARNFNVGLSIAYVFGSISKNSYSQVVIPADSNFAGTKEKTFYSSVQFRPGIAYRKKMSKASGDSAVFINLGITYEIFTGARAKESMIIQRISQNNLIIDQTTIGTTESSITLPSTLRAGVSFDKNKKWNFGADFSYTNWENYKGVSSLDTLKNSFTIGLGSEWVVGSKDGYAFNGKYLRAGFIFTKTPYYVNGKQINDIALTFGYSFPVGEKKNKIRPQLNLALVAGQRGSTEGNLLKDQYAKLYLGLTINDKWFRRRRVE